MAHTSLQIWGHHSDFISSYTESLLPHIFVRLALNQKFPFFHLVVEALSYNELVKVQKVSIFVFALVPSFFEVCQTNKTCINRMSLAF